MMLKDQRVLLCNCEGSMSLDGQALAKACDTPNAPQIHTHLCRSQLNVYEEALAKGSSILVACTQEAPMFLATADEIESETALGFLNIREKAGWSKESEKATPKIAALLAEALLDIPPARTVSMQSEGELIILGNSQESIEAANKISSRLSVTVFLDPKSDVSAPAIDSYPIFSGTIKAARGHLGAFEIDVEGVIPASPSSKNRLAFAGSPRSETTVCDLILDLRGKSLFPAADKRDGYFNPSPSDPLGIATALFELTDMIGDFEKPHYIDYNPDICAHSRSQITGCNKCIDLCPTGAIVPDGDHVKFDPYICAGCGDCASVCPTGAASYQMPDVGSILMRQRTLLSSYLKAGGENPVLLIHDLDYGEELIETMARQGDGLPANVIPFAVNSISQIGVESSIAAFAYGATRVQILTGRKTGDELNACQQMLELSNFILAAMGYGEGRASILDNPDPDKISETLYTQVKLSQPKPASFLSISDKRTLFYIALEHLNTHAPAKQEVIDLPAGAPFGTLDIDTDSCTLCLACVGSCPANALVDGDDKPQLKFREAACVQCGLCAKTCPEKVITLKPRLELTGAARGLAIRKEELPFECISCGKEFGTRSTINHMIEKLKGHSMFADGEALDRLKMCDDCRVISLTKSNEDPFRGPDRPVPRTTEDYIRERDEELAKAGIAKDDIAKED